VEGDEIFFLSVKECIQMGGDASTNAGIVGAMVGAYVGCRGLPEDLLGRVLNFDCSSKKSGGIRRNALLSVKLHAVDNIQRLIECRPSSAVKILQMSQEEAKEQVPAADDSAIDLEDPPVYIADMRCKSQQGYDSRLQRHLTNHFSKTSVPAAVKAPPYEV